MHTESGAVSVERLDAVIPAVVRYSGRVAGDRIFEKMVSLRINGEDRRFEVTPTIGVVLEFLQVPADAVAVEVNRTIVPRSTHEHHRLEDGDEIEVVTFVGGG